MEQPYLFEISSEAGRQIGGIYTVIKSKSRYTAKNFPNHYMFIGFYDESCSHDVKFTQPPKNIAKIFEQLARIGIYCHYGYWMYAQNTPIILVDAKQFAQRQVQYEDGAQIKNDIQLNYIKYLLWKHFQIDSLMERSYDFSENVAWGWAVGMLLQNLCKIDTYKNSPIIAHFHEWITAAGLLYSRLHNIPVATVFTTHATVLGRSLSSAGVDVLQKAQDSPEQIDISKAYELKVEGKHQLEMMAAKKAHVFTTVSQTVAQEVRYILGKYPDLILLNGLDFEEQQKEGQVRDISHYVRKEILQLCEAVLAPYYESRLDNALLLFSSGRYEYINKGFDIYIEALGKLNKKLKENPKDSKQVIALIFAPSASRGPKLSIIKNYLLLDKMNEVIDAAPSHNTHTHYHNTKQRIDDIKTSFKNDLNTMYSGLIKEGQRPPISLYELNYSNDEIINACLSNGLDNSEANPVKVFFYPTYLKPNDGLLNMAYSDVISGMDMGIFPSRYEPFGYTPLEAGLKLDISVSTDYAGFGRYLQSKEDLQDRGVKILPLSAGKNEATNELAEYINSIYRLNPSELEQKKHDSYSLMHIFDWKELISNYISAYDLALERAKQNENTHALVAAEIHPLSAISKKVALVAKAKQKITELKKKSATQRQTPETQDKKAHSKKSPKKKTNKNKNSKLKKQTKSKTTSKKSKSKKSNSKKISKNKKTKNTKKSPKKKQTKKSATNKTHKKKTRAQNKSKTIKKLKRLQKKLKRRK